MADFRKQFQELIEKSYIPTKANQATVSNIWHDIHKLVIPNIPEKLFRYRKKDDFSLEELRDGKMWLCHAGMFSDKYDSYLYVNHHKIREELQSSLKEALQMCLMHISQKSPMVKAESASRICYYRECGYTDKQIIDKIIDEEYSDFIERTEAVVKNQESRFRTPRNSAKIGCFTESVQSKYMWDRYGGGYKGFALEYDFRDSIFKYNKLSLNVNLLPIIYTDQRPDVTLDEGYIQVYEHFKQLEDKRWLAILDSCMSMNQLYWYKAYLYKDRKEYEHEHEWRMLYYNLDNEDDYESIPDAGCLKAIYYGPDIKDSDKEELHKIAMQRGLKEYNISLDSESPRYDLKISSLE